MSVNYVDIGDLSAKSSVAGTEKIVVSDTEYITPRQIAGRITGLVASNTSANATQWVVATTNLAGDGSHRSVFEVIGNSYDGNGPIHSVIQAVNTPSQSAFVSGWTRAVNLGKEMTYYVANANGYITLYFQIIHGVSVWISCHSGSNLDNRVTSVVMQDSAPTYTWRATATKTTLSDFLSLAGGTMTGDITLSNAIKIQSKDTGGTARTLLSLDASNNVYLAYGAAGAGYTTNVNGNIINLKYGTSRTTGVTLDASGITTFTGPSGVQLPVAVKRNQSGTQSVGIKFSTSNTELGAIGMNDVGQAYVREGTASTYYTVYTSKNITISSSEPTSSDGADGDIWIVI